MNKTILELKFVIDLETKKITTEIHTPMDKKLQIELLKEFIESYEKEN